MRKPLSSYFFRLVIFVVVFQLFTTPLLHAEVLTPDIVRDKIQERGRDARVWLREKNGVYLHGRVNIIGHDSFQLQLWNNPNLVEVRYDEVSELHQGLGVRGSVVVLAVTIGAAGGFAAFAAHEYDEHKDQTLPTPTLPSYPAFR
jgi:hypothetical protein